MTKAGQPPFLSAEFRERDRHIAEINRVQVQRDKLEHLLSEAMAEIAILREYRARTKGGDSFGALVADSAIEALDMHRKAAP